MNETMDHVTLKEAAQLSERSLTTVKRWIQDGILHPVKKGGKTSPLLIPLDELKLVLMDKRPKRKVDQSKLGTFENRTQADMNQAREDHIRALTVQVEDLRADKARMLRELDEARERIQALERAMNGGARGLLKPWTWFKRGD